MSRSARPLLLTVVCLAALSVACALSAPAASPQPLGLATQVEATLQALPSQTPPPAAPAQPPSATLPPSATTVPTATPSPTVTSEASSTPSPTPASTGTAVSGDPRGQLGNPVWRDDFSSGSNWTLGEDSFTRAKVEDGKLLFTGLTSMDGWRLTWPEIEDFYLEANLNSGDCEGNDHYGLIFRVPDRHAADEGYLLGFTCDGRYWLRHWGDEKMKIGRAHV